MKPRGSTRPGARMTRADAAQRHARRPAVGGTLFEPSIRYVDGSYYHVYRRLPIRTPLLMPRVFLQGPRWRQFNVTFVRKNRVQHHPCLYDFADDVRELVCEPLQYDRVALWSDPYERLGLTRAPAGSRR